MVKSINEPEGSGILPGNPGHPEEFPPPAPEPEPEPERKPDVEPEPAPAPPEGAAH